jgi:hypothetical protein
MEGYEYQQNSTIGNPDSRAGKVVLQDNLNNGISIRAIKEAFLKA